MLRKVNVTVA